MRIIKALSLSIALMGFSISCTKDNSDQALYIQEDSIEASTVHGCPDGSCSKQSSTSQ
ncbi:MAG: hypothetical protein AAF149_22780 [Bacteroidota bacterium]